MGRDDSESPVRGRGSPRRRSPSRRERSPPRHRSSRKENVSLEEKSYSRKKSPKNTRSRSPVYHSPVREKTSSHAKSPKYRKSVSPVREKPSSRARSPEKGKPLSRGRSPKRVKSRSPERRSPKWVKSRSPERRSPKRVKSRSPERCSPSPRTKRLKRLQVEREAEKMSDREAEENHGRRSEKVTHRERDSDRGVPNERKERRSRRDEGDDNGIPRSRRSTSPSDHNRRSDNRARDEVSNSRESDHRNGDEDSVAKMKAAEEALESKDKQKPSFELSGKLAAETNRVRGVTLLFTEPPEARKPDIRWRLYVFKGGEALDEPLYIHRQSCYLFGRERRVADIPTDHPSCSKQHAVLQYRQVEIEKADGTLSKQVKPYLMDLGSTNCTAINDNKMEPQRYYELIEGDTIKFGNSSREYVLLHEKSAG